MLNGIVFEENCFNINRYQKGFFCNKLQFVRQDYFKNYYFVEMD